MSGIMGRFLVSGLRFQVWLIDQGLRCKDEREVVRGKCGSTDDGSTPARGVGAKLCAAIQRAAGWPRETVPFDVLRAGLRSERAWIGRPGICVILYTISGTVVKRAAVVSGQKREGDGETQSSDGGRAQRGPSQRQAQGQATGSGQVLRHVQDRHFDRLRAGRLAQSRGGVKTRERVCGAWRQIMNLGRGSVNPPRRAWRV